MKNEKLEEFELMKQKHNQFVEKVGEWMNYQGEINDTIEERLHRIETFIYKKKHSTIKKKPISKK
jgi:hypothetical protein